MRLPENDRYGGDRRMVRGSSWRHSIVTGNVAFFFASVMAIMGCWVAWIEQKRKY
jgi:hypothetical protein